MQVGIPKRKCMSGTAGTTYPTDGTAGLLLVHTSERVSRVSRVSRVESVESVVQHQHNSTRYVVRSYSRIIKWYKTFYK